MAHHLPFGLRQLRYDQIVLGLPFKQAGASLSFSSTGFDLHRELGWRLALGFSRRSLSLGAGLNLLSLAQRGVPSRRFLAPTAIGYLVAKSDADLVQPFLRQHNPPPRRPQFSIPA